MAVEPPHGRTQIEDEASSCARANRIREALGDRAHVNLTSYFHRQALLTGEVATAQDRQAVAANESQVGDVLRALGRQDLAVMPPSTLTSGPRHLHHRQGARAWWTRRTSRQLHQGGDGAQHRSPDGPCVRGEANRATDIAGGDRCAQGGARVPDRFGRRAAPHRTAAPPVTTDTKFTGG